MESFLARWMLTGGEAGGASTRTGAPNGCRDPRLGHEAVLRDVKTAQEPRANMPVAEQWFASAFRTRVFTFIAHARVQRGATHPCLPQGGRHLFTKAACTRATGQLLRAAGAGKPNPPQDAVPHGWLPYVVTADRWPETLGFVPRCDSFLRLQYCWMQPWRLCLVGAAWDLHGGDEPLLSSHHIFRVFMQDYYYFFLNRSLAIDTGESRGHRKSKDT